MLTLLRSQYMGIVQARSSFGAAVYRNFSSNASLTKSSELLEKLVSTTLKPSDIKQFTFRADVSLRSVFFLGASSKSKDTETLTHRFVHHAREGKLAVCMGKLEKGREELEIYKGKTPFLIYGLDDPVIRPLQTYTSFAAYCVDEMKRDKKIIQSQFIYDLLVNARVAKAWETVKQNRFAASITPDKEKSLVNLIDQIVSLARQRVKPIDQLIPADFKDVKNETWSEIFQAVGVQLSVDKQVPNEVFGHCVKLLSKPADAIAQDQYIRHVVIRYYSVRAFTILLGHLQVIPEDKAVCVLLEDIHLNTFKRILNRDWAG